MQLTWSQTPKFQSRQQSERIRGEALRLIADRDRRTVASQRQVDHQLEDRIRNIATWRSELGAELDRNKNETNLMFKTRSENPELSWVG